LSDNIKKFNRYLNLIQDRHKPMVPNSNYTEDLLSDAQPSKVELIYDSLHLPPRKSRRTNFKEQ